MDLHTDSKNIVVSDSNNKLFISITLVVDNIKYLQTKGRT